MITDQQSTKKSIEAASPVTGARSPSFRTSTSRILEDRKCVRIIGDHGYVLSHTFRSTRAAHNITFMPDGPLTALPPPISRGVEQAPALRYHALHRAFPLHPGCLAAISLQKPNCLPGGPARARQDGGGRKRAGSLLRSPRRKVPVPSPSSLTVPARTTSPTLCRNRGCSPTRTRLFPQR